MWFTHTIFIQTKSHLFKWKISTDSLCNVCKVEEGYNNFFMSCKYLDMVCNSAFKYRIAVYFRGVFIFAYFRGQT